MKGRLALLVGAGIGYVLGARAGRQQFDKIKGWATQTWNDPRVQDTVGKVESTASQFAKDQGGSLKDKVKSATSRGGGSSQPDSGDTGFSAPATPSGVDPVEPVEPLPGTTPRVDDDRPTTF